jgi:hypothetical protein
VRIHLARKHALKLESFDFRVEPQRIRLDFSCGAVVPLGGGEFEQLARIRETAGQLVETVHDLFELGALAAEFLGAFGRIPDARLF